MKLRIAVLALALSLGGCNKNTTTNPPAPPNSPQTTVALTVKTVADGASACIDTVIALRNQGKLTPPNATTVGNWCSFVASTDKQLTAILANGQPWAQQKTAILALLGTVTAPQIATTIDPGAQAAIATIMTAINQIRVGVSQ